MFAPLTHDPEPGFLPAIVVRATVHPAPNWQGRIALTFTPNNSRPSTGTIRRDGVAGTAHENALLGVASPGPVDVLESGATLAAAAEIGGSSERTDVTFVLGGYDSDGRYAAQYPTSTALLDTLIERSDDLTERFDELLALLPRTGDAEIDEYLRWYSSAAILLTKGLRTGEVISMGYVEMNPRDSFWATGIHLVFWPDLERRMVLEIAEGQHPSGRIPSTVLPVIDRGDEIDVSSYFVLRVARYFRWHRDTELLTEVWPAVTKAIEYVLSRDVDGVGVPRQTSLWADWKDVPGVEGRAYAPHFALLWIAALAAAEDMARQLGDATTASQCAEVRTRAVEFVNRPYDDGGMWAGRNYVDRWDDGRRTDYVLQDQTVGAVFGVIPPERLAAIHDRLSESESPYGVRETYPYVTDFEQPHGGGGFYHNGGIWPFLNWIDATGRYAAGRGADAERIIRKVGHADLVAEGDYQPGEFLTLDPPVGLLVVSDGASWV